MKCNALTEPPEEAAKYEAERIGLLATGPATLAVLTCRAATVRGPEGHVHGRGAGIGRQGGCAAPHPRCAPSMSEPIWLEQVRATLIATGAVPLPGGHGIHFSGLRRRQPVIGRTPGAAERCYVCLTYLGETGADEKWNGRAWLPHAAAWFDIYAPEIASRLPAPRWSVLLDAMVGIAVPWTRAQAGRRHLETHVLECARAARERLRRLQRRAGEVALAQPMTRPSGFVVEPASEAWNVAAGELAGGQAGLVQALYFLHVLHSSLGLAQPDPDEPYENRRLFYQVVVAVLRGAARICGLCACATVISEAMSSLAVLNRPGAVTLTTAMLARRLPECFRPAHQHSSPPARAMVASRLSGTPVAQERLLAAHDLAEAVADLILDPLRSGLRGNSGFQGSHYGYLDSLLRYGSRRHAAATRAGAFQESADAPPPHRPLSRGFIDRMTSERLASSAHARLVDAGAPMSEAGCALCHIPQREGA